MSWSYFINAIFEKCSDEPKNQAILKCKFFAKRSILKEKFSQKFG